ncbi:MAG: protein phosphatase CheZ [Burkholderiales bacterium]|nr:protein phosphatase CheZ [Burkholderiales bacterium]
MEASSAAPAGADPHEVFQRIGRLTRRLHDALAELGYDRKLEQAVGALPDARARLAWIASVTGRSAERVLAAVERGKAQQEALRAQARALEARWASVPEAEAAPERARALADETRAQLAQVAALSAQTDGELTEIMMAQDFHDLTGQVLARIAALTRELEDQLVALLIDTTPPERRARARETGFRGPVTEAEPRTDVAANQAQVDELLASLGF